MNKIEEEKINAKDVLKRVIPSYKEKINNSFNLEDETKEKLTQFYNRTNERVLALSLAEYQEKLLKQEEKQEIGNFCIEVLAITKSNFSKNERLYLLSLYINKLVEYDFESLGLTSIDIIKKRTGYDKITPSSIYDMNDKENGPESCYKLKLGFSPMKVYIEENQYNNKMKLYHSLVEK